MGFAIIERREIEADFYFSATNLIVLATKIDLILVRLQ